MGLSIVSGFRDKRMASPRLASVRIMPLLRAIRRPYNQWPKGDYILSDPSIHTSHSLRFLAKNMSGTLCI